MPYMPCEDGREGREPRIVVLRRAFIAYFRKVGADSSAPAVYRVAGAAAFLVNDLLGAVNQIRSLGFLVVAVAYVALHLDESVRILHSVFARQSGVEEGIVPVLQPSMRVGKLRGISLSAVA